MCEPDFSFMDLTAPMWACEGALTAAEVLLTYVANVLDKPSAFKFRRISAGASGFVNKLGACSGAMEVFCRCGWTLTTLPHGDFYVLHRVDVPLLRKVRTELSVAIRTAEAIRTSRQGAI
uniref:PUB domain-containing protein n=1 Tax=Coccolithus braarudii TaxID=221442 RepID=A0A7S0L3G6_9EUKA